MSGNDEHKRELEDIRARIEAFEQSLPTELDPLALSRAKVPFKLRGNPYPLIVGINNLAVAVRMFGHSYNALGERMPQFVALCESLLVTGNRD